MKLDPYKHKEKYEEWKKNPVIKKVSRVNSKLIIEYLFDMEAGINVNCVKGGRSYPRLNNLRQRLGWIVSNMEKRFKIKNITKLTDRQAVEFFNAMRNGIIKRKDGQQYLSVQDYAWVFKAFWHWYQKRERKNGNGTYDITVDIDTNKVKESGFVYFTIEDMKRMAERSKYEYKVMMYFLFDSGIRSPTELMNIKVNDLMELENNGKIYQLHIRDEISKTFGRKIKLLICSQLLKQYIEEKQLKDGDYLFKITPQRTNEYIKRVASRVFSNKKTKGGKNISEITMYDFRHASVCYWLPRYKSENALMYRFGWKKSNQIHHYSKLLGMKDTISEDDMLIDITKTEIEKRLEQKDKEVSMLNDKIDAMQRDFLGVMKKVTGLYNMLKNANQS